MEKNALRTDERPPGMLSAFLFLGKGVTVAEYFFSPLISPLAAGRDTTSYNSSLPQIATTCLSPLRNENTGCDADITGDGCKEGSFDAKKP